MSDDFPNRQTTRLLGYDYSKNGYYFVTIGTHNMENILGQIVSPNRDVRAHHDAPGLNIKNSYMKLNKYGEIIKSVLNTLPKRFPIKIDISQIMPNHIHLIIIIMNRAIHESPVHRSLLSKTIGYFKMNSSKLIHAIDPKIRVFHRNYYDRIIRSEREYKQIVYYIRNNPKNWENDINYV